MQEKIIKALNDYHLNGGGDTVAEAIANDLLEEMKKEIEECLPLVEKDYNIGDLEILGARYYRNLVLDNLKSKNLI